MTNFVYINIVTNYIYIYIKMVFENEPFACVRILISTSKMHISPRRQNSMQCKSHGRKEVTYIFPKPLQKM